MAIRCSAKAILVCQDQILLNRCEDRGRTYFDLPGGGQHAFETMEEAVRREVLEETGYAVRVGRFAAIAEEIFTDPLIRENHPDYAHRMLHIFTAELESPERKQAAETDLGQTGCEWIGIDEADRLPLRPVNLCGQLRRILNSDACTYLGAVRVSWENY